MTILIKGGAVRKAEHGVNPLFPDRWSPRAMSGESMTDDELLTLFEAARWAPSCFNDQPWRFFYAKREDAHWEDFFGLLVPGNQEWCRHAAVLIVVVSSNNFRHNGKPNPTHRFDAGAAWQNLALQASLNGLVAHGMAGIKYDDAPGILNLPDDYTVECMVAIGKPGDTENLPDDLKERESPNDRLPVEDIAIRGKFE